MLEPTHERGAPSRMRFATCRSARALPGGVPDILVVRKEHRTSIPETVGPETVGDARDHLLDDRITRKHCMVSRIAPSRLVARAVAL